MRKPYFRPLTGLTIITAIMMTILIGLGTWQYKRLGWKTDLLAEIDKAANAAPLTSLKAAAKALDNKSPLDFRRVEIDAEFLPFETPFRVYAPGDDKYGWRLFAPVRNEGFTVFAGLNIIADGAKPDSIKSRTQRLAGYIRVVRKRGARTKSTPAKNRWFGFNPMPESHNWKDDINGMDVRYYLDIVLGENDAANLPVKFPKVRNNHLEYMLTWYSLALILMIYYVLLHRREGRAGWS